MGSGDIGNQIVKLRKEMGLSQEALAERSQVSRNYLSQIERGLAHNISTGVLKRLATVLSTTPAALMREPEHGTVPIPASLREFGLKNGLSFELIDTLARIQWSRKRPKTAAEWQRLYEALGPYFE